MSTTIRIAFISVLFLLSVSSFSREETRVITVDGVISPSSSEFIKRSLTNATDDSVHCFIILLNTPGGLVTSMREITGDILNSSIPVVIYVSPSGARAGSAGVFITMSAHIAAMAPGTNIGAASVVSMGASGDSLSATMLRKATNDAVAYIRSIAEKRGRNADWAEDAVRNAVSITASDAVEQDVVDYVVENLDSLYATLQGIEVVANGDTIALAPSMSRTTFVEKPFMFRLLDIITDPQVAYFLLIIALWGFMFELYNPGGIIPGVVAVICFVLFLYSSSSLPINYAGVALILLAIVFFLLEIKIASYGALTIGGLISFVLGSIMLYDNQLEAFAIPWQTITIVTIATALIFLGAMGMGLKAQKRKITTGREQIEGSFGESLQSFRNGSGQIMFEGEIWQARSDHPIRKGENVRILKMDGLMLEIEPVGE